MNINSLYPNEVEDLIKHISKVSEEKVLSELSDLVEDGLLVVVNERKPALVQDLTQRKFVLRLESPIKLELRDQQAFNRLKEENQRLRKIIDEMEMLK